MLSFSSVVPYATNKILSKLHSVSPLRASGRNVQISVIGAASEVGSKLALLLKHNTAITQLKLYDEDRRVLSVGLDVAQVPGGPALATYTDPHNLPAALAGAAAVAMVARLPRKPGDTREQMMDWNAPAVLTLCHALAHYNPEAILAISTNPINSIVPFASTVLQKLNAYNPYKVVGITQIDAVRSRALAANVLRLEGEAEGLYVPVIGGHSDHTIIPLYSHMKPAARALDPCQADTLTRLVRKAGTEVVLAKRGTESATLAAAWAINEFIGGLVEALRGNNVTLNCYTANPFFGTRYFSGPTTLGPNGIVQTCSHLPMTEYESYLLNAAVPALNRDIAAGEEYYYYVQDLGKK